MICAACGSTQPDTNRFCGQCGAELTEGAEEPRFLAIFARRRAFLIGSFVVGGIAMLGFMATVLRDPNSAIPGALWLVGVVFLIGIVNLLNFRCPKCGAHFLWWFGESMGIWFFRNCPKCGVRLRR